MQIQQSIWRKSPVSVRVAKMNKERPVYLDYQATTPLDPRVYKSMQPYFKEQFGNPHSHNHSMGWESHAAVEKARKEVADMICADANEIVFTSGATEANNLALIGIARKAKPGKNRILVSSIEHKCVLEASRYLSGQGLMVQQLPVDDIGLVDLSALKDLMDDDVLLVSIMTVNNEIGTIQRIEEIAKIVHQQTAFFHTDAAQAPVTKIIDVLMDDMDLMSLSAHKMYGPKGIGALYVKNGIERNIEPLFWGGGQENGLRSGTLPVALCVGFGAAAKILNEHRDEIIVQVKNLRDNFYQELSALKHNVTLIGPDLSDRHVGNLSILFPEYDASDLLTMLQPNLAASTGAACTSGIPEPSHVLRALGLSGDLADHVIRFSFGKFLSEDDIIRGIELLKNAVERVDAR